MGLEPLGQVRIISFREPVQVSDFSILEIEKEMSFASVDDPLRAVDLLWIISLGSPGAFPFNDSIVKFHGPCGDAGEADVLILESSGHVFCSSAPRSPETLTHSFLDQYF
jgi:hypothetical protein